MWLVCVRVVQAIFVLVLLVGGILIIGDLSELMRATAEWFKRKTSIEKKEELRIALETSATILVVIDRMIEMKINSIRSWHLAKGTACNFLAMDKEIDMMSKEIHNALPPYVFDENDDRVGFHPKFIEQYIVETITLQIATVYRDVNLELAQLRKE